MLPSPDAERDLQRASNIPPIHTNTSSRLPKRSNKDLLEALTGTAASLGDCRWPRSRKGPKQGESKSPASLPADAYETAAQEPTFPSQPQTVIHVLPAGQSQLPTEHHMICSDIRSGRDSPSASPFHACGLHHSAPWLAWKQVIQSQAVVFFSQNIFWSSGSLCF